RGPSGVLSSQKAEERNRAAAMDQVLGVGERKLEQAPSRRVRQMDEPLRQSSLAAFAPLRQTSHRLEGRKEFGAGCPLAAYLLGQHLRRFGCSRATGGLERRSTQDSMAKERLDSPPGQRGSELVQTVEGNQLHELVGVVQTRFQHTDGLFD